MRWSTLCLFCMILTGAGLIIWSLQRENQMYEAYFMDDMKIEKVEFCPKCGDVWSLHTTSLSPTRVLENLDYWNNLKIRE